MSIPVLMYHSISNDNNKISVSVSNFKKQMRLMHSLGYKGYCLNKINLKTSKKKFVITFDDGYENIFTKAMKQVCIYSFSKYALDQFSSLQLKTPLEKVEDIEILRFLELGFKIKMVKVSNASIAIDTPEDLIKAKKIINEKNI